MVSYLVLICLFLIPFYIFRFSIFGLPTNIFEISTVITFLIFLGSEIFKFLRQKKSKIEFSYGYLAAYFLLLFSAISVFFAEDRIRALGIFKGWFLVPAILYFRVLNLWKEKKVRQITIPIYISMIIVSIWAGLQKLGIISTFFYQVGDSGFSDYLSRFRAFGPFESPNYLAMYLVPAIFISLPILGYFKRTSDKILLGGLYILPLHALYASHSLGGLLAFGFAVISILSFGLTKEYRAKLLNSGTKVTVLALALIISAVAFSLIFSSVDKEIYSRNIRVEIYHYSGELIKTRPISGIGLGEFQDSVEEISKGNAGFQLYGLSYALHPHNLFLAFWLNLGILGFLSFLFLLWSYFRNLARRGGDLLFLASLFAAMIAILIHGIFDTTYFKNDLSVIFWLLLALSIIVGEKKDARSTK